MKNLAVVVILAFVAVASASGQAVTSTSPVSFFVPASQCPQIAADISGSGVMRTVSVTTVVNGTIHEVFNFAIHGTAVDANDTRYIINHVDTFTFIRPVAGPPPSELSATETFLLIGQGGASNVSLQGVFHVRRLSNGTLVSFVDNFRATGAEGCFPE